MTAESDTDIDYGELATLKDIALAGALDGPGAVTTGDVVDRLDASRRTVSNHVRRLRDADYLAYRGGEGEPRLHVTDSGRAVLAREYADYCRLFEPARPIRITGGVAEGAGEASGFVSLPGYAEQFREHLGYDPFPGTLNVAVYDESEVDSYRLEALDGVRIDGWKSDGRTYGGVTCYPVSVETADAREYDSAHVLVPDRTHHDASELEILAPDRLRDELGLRDGDRVTVYVSS